MSTVSNKPVAPKVVTPKPAPPRYDYGRPATTPGPAPRPAAAPLAKGITDAGGPTQAQNPGPYDLPGIAASGTANTGAHVSGLVPLVMPGQSTTIPAMDVHPDIVPGLSTFETPPWAGVRIPKPDPIGGEFGHANANVEAVEVDPANAFLSQQEQ